MHAYIDESARVQPPGWYVLAAVLVPGERRDEVRQQMQRMVPSGQRRLHWRDESDVRRREYVKAIAELQLRAIVVTATPIDRRRVERARRMCLLRLLWELEQADARDVLLESRQNRDQHDRSAIEAGRRTGHVSRELRYAFGLPKEEPLLWLPDVFAGATASALAGVSDEASMTLGQLIRLVQVGSGT